MTGHNIHTAAEYLRAGEVVAIPTETVYGLAANIYNEDAVKKIYSIKERPLSNPLIVHVGTMEQVYELTTAFSDEAKKLAAAFWPGPLTIILPKAGKVPDIITASQDTVAVRMPAHELTLALLKILEFPLAAPSANKFMYISPVEASAVEEMLGDEVKYILDGGACQRGIESTIVRLTKDGVQILRQGAVTEEMIRAKTGLEVTSNDAAAIAHPGMHKKHYSPRTRLVVTGDIPGALKAFENKNVAYLVIADTFDIPATVKAKMLSASGNLEEAAQHLYGSLYELDKEGYDLIVAEKFPDHGIGRAVNERLQKAAASL